MKQSSSITINKNVTSESNANDESGSYTSNHILPNDVLAFRNNECRRINKFLKNSNNIL